MHKQGSKGSFTTIDSFGNRKLTAKTQVPDTIFKSNSERAADDLSILASIEPFLLEDVPNPGRKDSANSYLRDANAPTSPKQNRIHTLPQAGPKIKLSSLKDGSDPDLNAPPLARKLTQPNSNLNLKRSSTGIRKLSNSNNKQITTNSKTAHFLGSDLDITPARLKFTPEGNLPEETESVTESSSDDYTPPVERGSDLRRKSEVSVASFFRNPLARWRRQATSPQPTFPIQEEFISPPFMAVAPWIPADGKTVATGCLVVTCLAKLYWVLLCDL
ncbi:hypothetical protein BDR26DRAFT_930931 [Obelidium mucronatum]|nr:hypothetical protein BDR26DRAFT_930931 [Obelidium mucronatum]